MNRLLAVIVLICMCGGCATVRQAMNGDFERREESKERIPLSEEVVAAPIMLVKLAFGMAFTVVASPVYIGILICEDHKTHHVDR